MIEKLTPLDIGMLVGAAIMALGAFCPILHVPIVGSVTYVMGGRGDGILIVLAAMAIIVLVITGYRRMAGLVATGALAIMLRALMGFSSVLAKASNEVPQSLRGNPFGGLAKGLVNSVSVEWGWLLLIGGALAVIVLAIVAHAQQVPAAIASKVDESYSETDFVASADQRIAEYLENRKTPSQRAAAQNVDLANDSKSNSSYWDSRHAARFLRRPPRSV